MMHVGAGGGNVRIRTGQSPGARVFSNQTQEGTAFHGTSHDSDLDR
jgi:hypothetical protein